MAMSNNLVFLVHIKKWIINQFGLIDLGPVSKYLGVQLNHYRVAGVIWLDQAEYILFLLQEYDLMGCNPAS